MAFFKIKGKKILIWILLFSVLMWLAWFGRDFFIKPLPPPTPPLPIKKVEINFEILDNPFMKELKPFKETPPFEGEIGRENPFLFLEEETEEETEEEIEEQ